MAFDIDGILGRVEGLTDEQRVALRTLLLVREDGMADHLRLAAQQFGMYPEIVAEVMAEVGLGTPVSDEARMLIRNNFVTLMRRLQSEQGN